ncbi:flagellar protein FlaG [Bacillus rubiinfantis]|uniref:flagellar protein FlaG n=1 Tax=Bacillus rubiinfantis TaxID=1499680 RepID=UPI0005A8EC78|nr:flagellar protein FlaG [Bacillus rubiinfantis]
MLEKVSNQTQTADFQVKQVEQIPRVKEIVKEKEQPLQQDILTKDKTEKVIESMNDFLKESNTHLKFQFHDQLQEYYVAIVDDATNEVIKEIPPKKFLDMYAAMTEYLGLLVDKKA